MRLSGLYLSLVLIFKTYNVFPQDYIVKGIGFVSPIYEISRDIYNFGVEKKLIKSFYLDLNASYSYVGCIECAGDNYYRFLSGIKYYYRSENKIINNIWGSFYFKYSYIDGGNGFPDGGLPDVHLSDYRFYNCNTGIAAGKKYYLTKKKRLFIDSGLGIEAGKTTYLECNRYKWDYGIVVWESHSLPGPFLNIDARLIFQIGYAFKASN